MISIWLGPINSRIVANRSEIGSAVTLIVLIGIVTESITTMIVTACLRIESSSHSITVNKIRIVRINARPDVISIVRLAVGIRSIAILACHGVGVAFAVALARRSLSFFSARRSFTLT